jgi:hypothetical protein
MTRRPALGLLLLLATLGVAGPAAAASWGGITPGQTTRREVEARYGRPARERVVTEQGLTGSEWIYSGDRAPKGFDRMVVGFGLVRGSGFVPDLVRSLELHPLARVFSVVQITQGWGRPDAIGTDPATARPAMRWDARGLLVVLDRSGQWAELMLFAPEQSKP